MVKAVTGGVQAAKTPWYSGGGMLDLRVDSVLEGSFSKGIDSVELTESFSSFSSPTPSRRLVNQHREEIHLRFAYRTFLPESYVPP